MPPLASITACIFAGIVFIYFSTLSVVIDVLAVPKDLLLIKPLCDLSLNPLNPDNNYILALETLLWHILVWINHYTNIKNILVITNTVSLGQLWHKPYTRCLLSFPVAQLVEHGASNAKIMGSIPRESKSWSNVKL